MFHKHLLSVAVVLALAGCAAGPAGRGESSASTQGPGTTENPQIVKSRDGSFSGEVIGSPRAGSKFSKLQIGMQEKEVQELMGKMPDLWHDYESGKRWIPFYFGNDARRREVQYKGEGCLTFTAGNVWGGAGGDLIRIHHDPSGACYNP